MEKSLVCAEKGIPNVVYSMPMLGTTVPATFAGCLAIANAEALSQLVVLQTKNPGTPVICGSLPSVMDMKTSIFAFGAPEMSLMVGALTEIFHHYRIPAFGTAGCTDAEVVGVQAGAEITYQIMTSALTGADLVHDVGIIYHDKAVSPELTVLTNEVIDMVKVLMGGIEINEETLVLDLIDRLGPESSYITEDHTFNHFRKFWNPKIFDRSFEKQPDTKDAEDLLNQRTIDILKNHQPKPLSEDLGKELKKVEKSWFDRKGLKHEYPQ
jgi:trimethylamine--corrinoid protein Co-methyltransferase